MQLSLSELLVMDCVTAWCGWQVQPTKITLPRQWVISSLEVRASDIEHGGSWVPITSGAQIFPVSSYGWFFTSPFITIIIIIITIIIIIIIIIIITIIIIIIIILLYYIIIF